MGLGSVMTQNYYFSANQNAKRLHGVPKWFLPNVQSPCRRVSHIMTKKNKQNKQRKNAINGQGKQKKATPFGDVGQIVGQRVGGIFGMPYLKGVGRWLGSGIGSIFGSGDYNIIGAEPMYNLLTNGNQIPKFSETRQTNIVCHREYIGDITGTTGFTNRTFPLNPGVSQTFPWLSSIAENYQEYKFHGLIFEFRPLITDFVTSGAPGVIVMATNYNSDASAYSSKQQMENSEYAVSVKPTLDLIHGVECEIQQTVLPQLYVRTGSVPSGQDLRLYDQGLFQFASQGNPSQLLGELWVSYCVEFFKPVLPITAGLSSAYINRSNTTNASPMGSIGVVNRGDLAVTITSTVLTIPANPNDEFYITLHWYNGSVNVVIASPGITIVGGTFMAEFQNGTTAVQVAPFIGASTNTMIIGRAVKSSLTAPGIIIITLDGSGTVPAGQIDIVVTKVSPVAFI